MNIHKIYGFFMRCFRPRRLARLKASFPELGRDVTILDVGGGAYPWIDIASAARVTILNQVFSPGLTSHKRFTFVRGDGRQLPFPDQSFDLVFSNSVVEHVGSYDDQRRLTAELRRVGRSLYCQTPNKWFFFEPHLIAPFIHWLPYSLQRRLVRWVSVWHWVARPTQYEIDEFLRTTRLLSYREITELFPECEIQRERFLFMTKSYIVMKRG